VSTIRIGPTLRFHPDSLDHVPDGDDDGGDPVAMPSCCSPNSDSSSVL
jgi:hypothetical protein